MITHSIRLLNSLQYPSGLIAAASQRVSTGYDKAWIRDNIYAALGFEAAGDINAVKAVYRALLDILKRHDYKIEWMIRQPLPKAQHRYIHARYDPFTGMEFHEEWGNKQNDAVGAFLFKVGDLESRGTKILRDESDRRVLQKLVRYLQSLEYWRDSDNGMWEENEEVHASSIGACVAGLQSVRNIVSVPEDLIKKGKEALNKLLPRESDTKEADMALLSLIYPYGIVSEEQQEKILESVEKNLVRNKGVIRYANDNYYGNNNIEAEWPLGFVWLAVIYKNLNQPNKREFYLEKARQAMNSSGEIPELYYGNTEIHNENTPLGWAQAFFIVASA